MKLFAIIVKFFQKNLIFKKLKTRLAVYRDKPWNTWTIESLFVKYNAMIPIGMLDFEHLIGTLRDFAVPSFKMCCW